MRHVLVTGANKGIGLATVTAILDEHDDTDVFLRGAEPRVGRHGTGGPGGVTPRLAARQVVSHGVQVSELLAL